MRMWNVNPRLMCNQHLLGEHVEIHMFVGVLRRGRSVVGYLERGLLEVHNLQRRHDCLVREMVRRKMIHKSPLPKYRHVEVGTIDSVGNTAELYRRCHHCAQRMKSENK